MSAANVLAYCAQVTLLVLACAALPRVVGLRSPGLQYGFWRALLAVCLALPILQPWRHEVMAFAPAPGPALLSSARASPVPRPSAPPIPPFDWATAAAIVLGAGAAARLAWLSLGAYRLHRMRGRAIERADGFADLQQTVGASAPILWSPDARHPVTFGILDPVILLPAALKNADAVAQRAVVAHELHHVKRRDWAWVLGEEIVRSIFWFHPAMRWLVSRVQLAREAVVDELSILTTNARRTYLDALLAFADDTGLASSPAFSARRHLFYRVMLLSKEDRMSSTRIAVGSCVLVLALGAGTWSAAQAFPLTAVKVGVPSQSPQPPRDPVKTTAQVHVQTFDEEVEQLKPVRIGGALKVPIKVKDVKPEYPQEAQMNHVQGVVVLEAIIGADGKIVDARILRSIPLLDDAALDAVKRWEFRPTLLNGVPQNVLMTTTVNFALQ